MLLELIINFKWLIWSQLYNIMADKANELKTKGNAAFQNGNFDEAVKLFTEAISINPNDHVFYSNRSGAYASLKKFDEALEDAKKCVEINPKWAKGYQRKGFAEFYQGDYATAAETYKKGLEIDPANASLKEGLQQAEEKLKEDDAGLGGFDINAMLKNPQAMQMMLKLMSHPDTKDLFADPNFMSTAQLLMQNPAAAATLAQTDPRFKKVLDVINSPSDPSQPDFMSMFGGAAGKGAGAGAGAGPSASKPKK